MKLSRGYYTTAINIHNPNNAPAELFIKLALTYPSKELRPGRIVKIRSTRLKYDEAIEVDCAVIQRALLDNGIRTPYSKGFVVIQSSRDLDVTAVYTVAPLDKQSRPGSVSSIDVEQVTGRRIKSRPNSPDLVPVPDAAGGFCRTRNGRLIVTVRNQGSGAAGPSSVEVDFLSFGAAVAAAPALLPGASTDVSFDIPASAFDPDAEFRITVDVAEVVAEEDEANNTADGICIG